MSSVSEMTGGQVSGQAPVVRQVLMRQDWQQ